MMPAAIGLSIAAVMIIAVVAWIAYEIGYGAARRQYSKMQKRCEIALKALENGDRAQSLLALTGEYDGQKEYRPKNF